MLGSGVFEDDGMLSGMLGGAPGELWRDWYYHHHHIFIHKSPISYYNNHNS